MPLLVLSAFAALSGYAFNVWVARAWGPIELGRLLGVLGAVGVAGVPATLLVLPVSRWAAQTRGWFQRLLFIQVGSLGLGLVVAATVWWLRRDLGTWLHVSDPSWWLPLCLWLVPTYLASVSVGVLMGRRAYISMGIVASVPSVAKLVALAALVVAFRSGPVGALWAVAISVIAQAISALIVTGVTQHSRDLVADSIVSVWPGGWVNATATTWMMWDTAVAAAVLRGQGLSTYAAAATIGRIPFHLTRSATNMGVSESGWSSGSRRETRFIIAGTGALSILLSQLAGHWVLTLMQVTSATNTLTLYLAANTILAAAVFEVAADAQEGLHTWWPLAVGLVVWTAYSLTVRPGPLELVAALGVALAASLLTSMRLSTRKRAVLRHDPASSS